MGNDVIQHPDNVRCVRSIDGIVRATLGDDRVQKGVVLNGWKFDCVVDFGERELNGTHAQVFEWNLARPNVVEHQPQRVDVRGVVVLSMLQHLRCDPQVCSRLACVPLVFRRFVRQHHLRDVEIRNLHVAVSIHEDVVGLEIAMKDAARRSVVKIVQPDRDVAHHAQPIERDQNVTTHRHVVAQVAVLHVLEQDVFARIPQKLNDLRVNAFGENRNLALHRSRRFDDFFHAHHLMPPQRGEHVDVFGASQRVQEPHVLQLDLIINFRCFHI